MLHRYLLSLAFAALLSSCASVGDKEKLPVVLKPASYGDLNNWARDDHAAALAAFIKSCPRIAKQDPAKAFGPLKEAGTFGDWQAACAEATSQTRPVTDAKAFFERYFIPYQLTAGGDEKGLFTGYYEASLRGSRTRHGAYQTPLRLRPADLVMVDLGEFRDELKGQRIAGRVVSGSLKPFEDRAAITAGKLKDDEKLHIVYVDDSADAFFLQVQGSGRVQLDDGTMLRIGYDAQNGHPYYAIGRELIKRGELSKDNVSMQAIRAWMAANPARADELMNTNRSYVFFRVVEGDGPIGGEGVALTPLRSMAIDRSKLPYGAAIWIDTDPIEPGRPRLQQLMVAQDTGGAIRGAVRGDFFWGYGPQAVDMAGKMKTAGEAWILLPRSSSK